MQRDVLSVRPELARRRLTRICRKCRACAKDAAGLLLTSQLKQYYRDDVPDSDKPLHVDSEAVGARG